MRNELPKMPPIRGEEWRWIEGTSQQWAVSSHGRVCSVDRVLTDVSGRSRLMKGRLLSLVTHKNGYLVVSVRVHGRKVLARVNILVANAFHGPNPHGLYVLHKNGNCADNQATNLYYGTARDNALDAIRHGTKARGVTHGMVKLTEHHVRAIRALNGSAKQRGIAAQFGIGQAQVQRILSRQNWAHLR